MVPRRLRDDCNESRLRSFLDDRLTEPETGQLADHLDHCDACRRALERLASGSRLYAALRESAPEFGPVLPRRPPLTETVGAPVRGGPKIDELIALDFLEPAAKPGSLGQLGPYDVKEVLGRGAFGVVLKAHDPELNRFVAIKVLAAPLAVSAAARSRFAREARAVAAVVHENVVAIHAVDSWNGLPYLVMPWIAGPSLQERVDRNGPLSVKEVLRIGMQAAHGLAAAHAQGIVHRDVKPSNILLENGVDRVKLSDFGLARAVDDASQTQSGVIAGTPQYMSPEQARGEAVDHRSDLFSLGGVMYFMCTGHPPFRADSTPAVLRRVCDDRPRPLRDVNPDVPDWLAEVIDRLLTKEAGGRFATASEVAEVLRRHLAEFQRTGTSAPLDSIPTTPFRERPGTRAVAAISMASVVLFGLAMIWAPNRDLALLPFLGAEAPQAANPAGAGDGGAPAPQADGGAPANRPIIGSGRPATKELGLADFEGLDVMHPFHVEVVRADRFGVTVTADDNVLEHVNALKEGSVLKIALAEGRTYRMKAGSLKATVAMPALASIGLSHGARATARGFQSDRPFTARLSHGATLEGEVEAGDITFEVSHGSTIHLKGKARDGRLVASHGSKLMLADLALRSAEIDAEHGTVTRFAASTIEGVKIRASHGSIVSGTAEAADVTVEAEHGATVILNGHARHAGLEASHESRLFLAGLALDGAGIELDHSASATVNAKDTLDYRLEHGAELEYIGGPKVGLAESSHSSKARSITADEVVDEGPAIPEVPSLPPPPAQGDIVISTVQGDIGTIQAGAPAAGSIIGSGRSASKAWEIIDFNAVSIGSTFRAEITRGDRFRVTTSSDDNVLEHLSVVKEGETLKIGLEPGRNYQLKEPLKAEVVLPALVGLDVGGASTAALDGFRSEEGFKLKLHGASKVSGSIEVGDAEFDVGGASHLTLNGSAKAARLTVGGASRLELAEFPLEQCEIRLSGASHARLDVRSGRPFKATASGSITLEGSVDAADVSLTLGGASVANLRGNAASAILEAADASRLGLAKFVLGEADVKLSGASQATVDIRDKLSYDLSPECRLDYTGDPTTLTGTKAKTATVRRQP